MHLNWNPLSRLVTPHHLLSAVTAVAAALIVLPAFADTSVTVAAGAVEAEVGVKSYEVSTETELVTDDSYWFCQVVGKPSIAGPEVTVMLLESRSFFVTNAGVQVACQALCDCNLSLAPAACRTIASTRHLAEFVACSYQYLVPQ